MTAVVPGITVIAAVTITDYAALGWAIAEADCEQQARFFLGLRDGFATFPTSMQMQSIKDEVGKFDRTAQMRLGAFINKLNDYLGDLS